MDLDHLFADLAPSPAPAVSGKWCTLRVTPDAATGEVFNIGVVFAPKGDALRVRLLPTAAPFRCLYGESGFQNYALLLRVLQEQLSGVNKAKDLPAVSPQVSMSPWAYAAGESAQEVAESLYQRMVTLNGCIDSAPPKPANHAVSTDDFRSTVRRMLPAHWKVFSDDPVTIKGEDGRTHRLDMPIWHEPGGLFPDLRFGNLISCHYKMSEFRLAKLAPACMQIEQATQARLSGNQKGLGFLVILRPRYNAPGYSPTDITAIENEIDELTWNFQKRGNLHTRVVESSDDAVELLQDFLA